MFTVSSAWKALCTEPWAPLAPFQSVNQKQCLWPFYQNQHHCPYPSSTCPFLLPFFVLITTCHVVCLFAHCLVTHPTHCPEMSAEQPQGLCTLRHHCVPSAHQGTQTWQALRKYLLNAGTNTPEHPATVPVTHRAGRSSPARASGSPIQLSPISSPRTASP